MSDAAANGLEPVAAAGHRDRSYAMGSAAAHASSKAYRKSAGVSPLPDLNSPELAREVRGVGNTAENADLGRGQRALQQAGAGTTMPFLGPYRAKTQPRVAQSSAALPPAAEAVLTQVPQAMSISESCHGQSLRVAQLLRS